MIIKKQGNLQKAELRKQRAKHFRCDMCECEWIAIQGEYYIALDNGDDRDCHCKCPTCGEDCRTY